MVYTLSFKKKSELMISNFVMLRILSHSWIINENMSPLNIFSFFTIAISKWTFSKIFNENETKTT